MSDFTFSEHGEDILIHRLLLWKENGFYVDVGCYHPRKMSMTARLRNFGWSGVNIDADNRVIDSFNLSMPHMKNVCAVVSDAVHEVVLRRYDDSVINTISKKQMAHLDNIEGDVGLFTSIMDEKLVKTNSLSHILNDIAVREIDFLNLDIEELELNALKGFPFDKFQPSVIACEIHRLNLVNVIENDVVNFLLEKGYILQSYVFHTAIFVLKGFDTELCHRVEFKSL